MPPKATTSLNTGNHSSRASVKARQAAQQAFLALHINKDGPYKKQLPDPMDFESLPLSSLRKARDLYGLNTPSCHSFEGELLNSKIGKKTYSYKNNKDARVSKKELADDVKKYVMEQPIRETEVIVNFLYAVHHKGMFIFLFFTM